MKLSISSVPKKLYHATYEPLLKSIAKVGLGGKANAKKMWEDSKTGVVYLADSKDIAESYAESSDTVNEDWLDQIVVFEIETKDLDATKLTRDRNVIDGDNTWEYAGVIPLSVMRKL